MADDIVERLRRWDDGIISTHWAGCMDTHPECAILFAADAIEARDAENARLWAEIERLRNALKEVRYVSNIFGDSDDAQTYIGLLNDTWKVANDALPEGSPSWP